MLTSVFCLILWGGLVLSGETIVAEICFRFATSDPSVEGLRDGCVVTLDFSPCVPSESKFGLSFFPGVSILSISMSFSCGFPS